MELRLFMRNIPGAGKRKSQRDHVQVRTPFSAVQMGTSFTLSDDAASTCKDTARQYQQPKPISAKVKNRLPWTTTRSSGAPNPRGQSPSGEGETTKAPDTPAQAAGSDKGEAKEVQGAVHTVEHPGTQAHKANEDHRVHSSSDHCDHDNESDEEMREEEDDADGSCVSSHDEDDEENNAEHSIEGEKRKEEGVLEERAKKEKEASEREVKDKLQAAEKEAAELKNASSAAEAIEAARRGERNRLEAKGRRALAALEARDVAISRLREEIDRLKSSASAAPRKTKATQAGTRTRERGVQLDRSSLSSLRERSSQTPQKETVEHGSQAKPTMAERGCGTMRTDTDDAMTQTGDDGVGLELRERAVQAGDSPWQLNEGQTQRERAIEEEVERAREEAEEARGEADRASALAHERSAQAKVLQDAMDAIEEGEERTIEAVLAEQAKRCSECEERNGEVERSLVDERLRAESAERARDRALERVCRTERRVSDLEGQLRQHEARIAAEGDCSDCPRLAGEEARRAWLEGEVNRLRACLDCVRQGTPEWHQASVDEEEEEEDEERKEGESARAQRESPGSLRRRASALAARVRELECQPEGEGGRQAAEEAARIAEREATRRRQMERATKPETQDAGSMAGPPGKSALSIALWRALERGAKLTASQKRERELEARASDAEQRLESISNEKAKLEAREKSLQERLRRTEEEARRRADHLQAAKDRASRADSELERERTRAAELERKAKQGHTCQPLQPVPARTHARVHHQQGEAAEEGNKENDRDREKEKEKEKERERERASRAEAKRKEERTRLDKARAELERVKSTSVPSSEVASLADAGTRLARAARRALQGNSEGKGAYAAVSLGLSPEEARCLLADPSLVAAEQAASSLRAGPPSERSRAISVVEDELRSCASELGHVAPGSMSGVDVDRRLEVPPC